MDAPETVADSIMRVVGEAGMVLATSEIIERTGAPASSVKPALSALVRAGVLVRPRHGYYTIPTEGKPPLIARGLTADTAAVVHIPLVSAYSGTLDAGRWRQEVPHYVAMAREIVVSETGIDPERLNYWIAVGDGMAGVINPGDRVMIAMRNGEPLISGGIYIWKSQYGDYMIKRLVLLEDGARAWQGTSDPEPVGHIMPDDAAPMWEIIASIRRVDKPV